MDELFTVKHAIWIPILPLIGAVISGFFGARWLKGKSHWPIWISVGASAVLSFMLLAGMLSQSAPAGAEGHLDYGQFAHVSAVHNYGTWIRAGSFSVQWGYFFDPL